MPFVIDAYLFEKSVLQFFWRKNIHEQIISNKKTGNRIRKRKRRSVEFDYNFIAKPILIFFYVKDAKTLQNG